MDIEKALKQQSTALFEHAQVIQAHANSAFVMKNHDKC
ncbi:MAG: hypothetical protein ACI936_000840 [Paraglaciecola sp.]|jgi:hypothetical protein